METIQIDAALLVSLVQRLERLERDNASLKQTFDSFIMQRRELAIIEQRYVERARGMEPKERK